MIGILFLTKYIFQMASLSHIHVTKWLYSFHSPFALYTFQTGSLLLVIHWNIPAHLFSSRPVITLIHKSISGFYSPCLYSDILSGFGVFAASFSVNSSQLGWAVSD